VKCINKSFAVIISCILIFSLTLCGCGKLDYTFAYNPETSVSGFRAVDQLSSEKAQTYARDLCVVSGDVNVSNVDLGETGTACLFDVNNSTCLYAKNPHERMNPASLTKIMTALVAVKHGSLDQVLTATNNTKITEYGAQVMELKAGDTMTLDQALHILLMYSANDVAMLIAENIGGTLDGFMEMMNEEAQLLGATNTHFTNPHGLTEEDHYTTAYDMYLIFNEAIKYDTIIQIINMNSYQTSYYLANGQIKDVSYRTTNLYLRDEYKAPTNVTVLGGKTGTTSAAGHCLILYSKNTEGKPYISVIMRSASNDVLYSQMNSLLSLIH